MTNKAFLSPWTYGGQPRRNHSETERPAWPPPPHVRLGWAVGEQEAAEQLLKVRGELKTARKTVEALRRAGASEAIELAAGRRQVLILREHDLCADVTWAAAALNQLSDPGVLDAPLPSSKLN